MFLQLTSKAIVVYPNSGEIWDGKAKKWLVSQTCFRNSVSPANTSYTKCTHIMNLCAQALTKSGLC